MTYEVDAFALTGVSLRALVQQARGGTLADRSPERAKSLVEKVELLEPAPADSSPVDEERPARS